MSEPSRLDDAGRFFDAYADQWDAFYQPENRARAFDYLRREETALEMLDAALPKNARVLEMGCGAGHCALQVAERGHDVECLDVSAEMIAATKRRFEAAGREVTTYVGTLLDLPSDEQYDAIYALGVIDYVPNIRDTFNKARRLLRPGGCLLISYTNDDTVFRKVEMPLKRAAALGMYVATRNKKYRDVALESSTSHSPEEAIDHFRRAGFSVVDERFFSYGIRMGDKWFPPFEVVEDADEKFAERGLSDWGRGFLVLGKKYEAVPSRVRSMHASDIRRVVPLHLATFAGSMGAELGPTYARGFLWWFTQEKDAAAFVYDDGGEVLGYVFGCFLDAQVGMNKTVGPFAAVGLLQNPGLMLRKTFRAELKRRVKLLRGGGEHPSKQDVELPGPVFSLVGIGTSPAARGKGVATALVRRFIDEGRARGAGSIRLSVYRDNDAARHVYERAGFEAYDHPTNPDVLYYAKVLGT